MRRRAAGAKRFLWWWRSPVESGDPAGTAATAQAWAWVELPFAPLRRRFDGVSPAGGRLDLRQGDDRNSVQLFSHGSASAEAEASGKPIAGSVFSVGAGLPDAFIVLPRSSFLSGLLALLGLGGGSYLLWLRLRHLRGRPGRSGGAIGAIGSGRPGAAAGAGQAAFGAAGQTTGPQGRRHGKRGSGHLPRLRHPRRRRRDADHARRARARPCDRHAERREGSDARSSSVATAGCPARSSPRRWPRACARPAWT